MKRPARIAFNTLAPPGLTALVLIVPVGFAALFSGHDPSHSLALAGMILAVAYVVAIGPSLIHALTMELVYRQFSARSWSAVSVSALSGLFAGVLIAGIFFFTGARSKIDGWYLIYPGLGAPVGVVLGLLVKLMSPSLHPPARSVRGCE